jgi:hypothetical protein
MPPSFNCHCHIIPRLPRGRLTCRLTRGAILEAGTKFLVVKRGIRNATNSATNVCIFTSARVRDSILVIRCHTCLLVIGKRCKRWTPVTLERRETVIPTGRFRRCWSWYGSGDIRICCYAILGTGTKSIERWFYNVTDSTADVFMIAIASVGYGVTVIQALACLLVITCLIQARLPGTLEAVGVPRGWLGDKGIEFVPTVDDILFILSYFERNYLSQRDRIRVQRSWSRRDGGAASCKINLTCARFTSCPSFVAHWRVTFNGVEVEPRRIYYGRDEWMEPWTDVARAWHICCIGRRKFKAAIIVDLTLSVLLRCAHLWLDGIGGRDSLGETAGPNSLASFASTWMVAEVTRLLSAPAIPYGLVYISQVFLGHQIWSS